MSLATIMLEQLAVGRRVVADGHEMVPAWRIETPEGAFLILTQFRSDKTEQRERALSAMSRFMTWKMATSFVLTAETGVDAERSCGGDEALVVIGVSRHERLAAMQRITRGGAVGFSEVQWLPSHRVDERYFKMLPTGSTELTAEDEKELARMFGKNGQLSAKRVN
jgi:hypothetical protein